jgi:hypothetical protein
MKEDYKNDNELVKLVADYFFPYREGASSQYRTDHKEFEIGGKTWICTETHTDGLGHLVSAVPGWSRIEAEAILTQKDGTKHPVIRLRISVGPGRPEH